MSSHNRTPVTPQESWVSALVDGEAFVSESAHLNDAVHEQLYYYTMTRQVIHGELVTARQVRYETHKATWVQFWARVDKI